MNKYIQEMQQLRDLEAEEAAAEQGRIDAAVAQWRRQAAGEDTED
jgi:hypothetical protein